MSGTIVHVAVFLPIEHLLTYSVPEHLLKKAKRGVRVLVPVRNSIEMGVILNVQESDKTENGTSISELKEVIDIPDTSPILNEEIIKLCQWISEYYISPPGQTFQLAVPHFLRSIVNAKYTLNVGVSCNYLPCSLPYEIIEVLKQQPLSLKEIKRKIKNQHIDEEITLLLKERIVKVIVEAPRIQEKIKKELWVQINSEKVLPQEDILAWQKKAPLQIKTYLFLLHEGKEYPVAELIKRLGIKKSTITSLYRKGWVKLWERESYKYPSMYHVSDSFTEIQDITLTEEQILAVEQISKAIQCHQFNTYLLYGITGSGKTEVYLQCIQTAIQCGYQSLMLVPEIALTPQTLSRLYSRFKDKVAILHSGLTDRERFEEWRKIQEGRVDVVVGVRSAIFAPFQKLGLIIVDEEHEHTYKQEETPKYHARDVAVMRAQINSAVCILGSATPSLESYVHALNSKYCLLRLTKRVASGSLPLIHIVDLKSESNKTVGEPLLSQVLKDKIHERLEREEQVILLINRRGFAPVVMCPSCGWVLPCPNCQTSLNYHRYDGYVHCHYCNFKKQRPVQCEECGSSPLILLGVGTQRIEDLLIQSFPQARIARMDTDITNSKIRGYSILKNFAEHKIDIIIGTQMIAKGHDYPKVTLVGVMNADLGLTLPNFRAPEFVFQLLMQVAGRSGRRERPGEVIIQTYMPNHYVMKAVQNHDYEMFVDYELRLRQKIGYPPYNRMIQFGVESEDEKEVKEMVYLLTRFIRNDINEKERDYFILGPAPGVIRRVTGRYRWQFALLGKATKKLNNIAREVYAKFHEQKRSSKILLQVDVDPYEIY